ncbi:protein TIME FOR COFFEE isoform X2 [Andrographis paniculata]|uniref:protein TIME FOR COFFEE isoform X2 n=1 Tax=Andrographis paniculata TaxID=175694 RepID=UPI0021E956EE|nr:protein TIME FOR COFFEE isoform X2 [Andrographis paniculata]
MERNRDFRRATVSSVNGLPRRRQRITTLRDSADEDRQMESKDSVRLRDRERLLKKERDREFPKRRRVDRSAAEQSGGGGGGDSYRESEITDTSDEEYYEEEEELKNYHHKGTNQLSPSSSSLSNNRRGFRTLRSSPVYRFPSDEIFGVPIPRRTRSVSAKRLQKRWISESLGFGEDSNNRRFSPVSPIGCGGGSPSSSSDSMKKKMKSVAPRIRVLGIASNSKPSVIQDDIEIEVAEALFDLMKQSHSQSQSQSSKIHEKADRDSMDTADCDLQRLKSMADQNDSISIQNEKPGGEESAETIAVDATKDLNKEGRAEKEKISDEAGDDGFVNKGTLGSQKESKSLSCVKVNGACDIKDPTVTKAEHGGTVFGGNRVAKLEIDLMASPPPPSSPERDPLVAPETGPKKKTAEILPEDGPMSVANHRDFEKQKNQASSLFTSPIGTTNWPGVLPHPGNVPSLPTGLPIDGSARSLILRPPQFKLSLPPPKRCATHQYIARNIDHHQQLIKNSLSSEPTPAESLNTKLMLPPAQILSGNGKDKSPCGVSFNAANAKPVVLQQQAASSTSTQAPAKNPSQPFSGFTFPLGYHNATAASMMAPASSSGPPPQSLSAAGSSSSSSLTCNSAGGKGSANLSSFPAVGFNHPIFSSNGTAPPPPPYMTILHNNGGPIPMPSFKGGSSTMPFLNSSLYSSYQLQPPSSSSRNDNKNPPPSVGGVQVLWPSLSSGSKPELESGGSSKGNHIGNGSSFPVQPMNFAVIPPLSVGSSGGVDNKIGDHSHSHSQQGAKGAAFGLSFSANPLADPAANYSTMLQTPAFFQMLNSSQMPKSFQSPAAEEAKFTSNGDHHQPFNFSKSDTSNVLAAASKFDGGLSRSVSYGPPTIPNFQQLHHQQQLNQLQQHHAHQMQQQQFSAQVKASSGSGSYFGAGFGSNSPVFAQLPDVSSLQSKWMNYPRSVMPTLEGSSQLKTSQGKSSSTTTMMMNPTPITFENGSATLQGQNITPMKGHRHQPESSPSSSSSSMSKNGSLKGAGIIAPSSSSSSTPPQESSATATPACRRNIPSILSTCPPQLSELKY